MGQTLAELPGAAFVLDAGRCYPVRRGRRTSRRIHRHPAAGPHSGLFSRGCFDYLERVAAPSVVVQKYKRLRAVEVALCGTLHDMVTDAALNFAARSCAVCWRTT